MKKLIVILLMAQAGMATAQNLVSGGPLKPEQANMDIRHYTVALDVNIAAKSIAGYAEIALDLERPSNVLLFNLVDLMKVEGVWVNGKKQSFQHEQHLLYVRSDQPFPAGRLVVKVSYGGTPGVAARPPWDGGFTWTKDSTGHPWVAVTSEGEGATILFPCKDHPSDEPDEGADLIVTVPKGLVVAGPGLLQSVKNRGQKVTYHWKTIYPINNYSILFNIGDYQVVRRTYTTSAGNKVPMEFYVLREHADKANALLDILEETAHVDEKYFGEYPWVREKIAIAETPHLGMEHQTMNAYGNKFRFTKLGGKDFDWLVHHEFGHEWWGNKITAKDWAHYWIQEGICTFGDALIVRELEGEEAYLKRMQQTARSLRNDKPVVMGDSGLTEDETYNPDIYGKGAFFMHTIRFVMGDKLFFPALKSFATDPRYTYTHQVTTNDVEEYFSTAAGQDLKPLFDLFLRTTDKLEIHVVQKTEDQYQVSLLNMKRALPLDIRTSNGLKRVEVDQKGVTVSSTSLPVIDPDVYYLKKVIYE